MEEKAKDKKKQAAIHRQNERRAASVKRYQENNRKRAQEKIKNGEWGLKRTPLKKVGKKTRRNNKARARDVKEWKKRGIKCEVIGCQNIPGQDGYPIQWDHKLDRERFPELATDPENTAITCGSHNDIDYKNGVKVPLNKRLILVKEYWGAKSYEWAKRKVEERKAALRIFGNEKGKRN